MLSSAYVISVSEPLSSEPLSVTIDRGIGSAAWSGMSPSFDVSTAFKTIESVTEISTYWGTSLSLPVDQSDPVSGGVVDHDG